MTFVFQNAFCEAAQNSVTMVATDIPTDLAGPPTCCSEMKACLFTLLDVVQVNFHAFPSIPLLYKAFDVS